MSQETQEKQTIVEPDEVVVKEGKNKTQDMGTEDYLGIGAIILGVINLCA